MKNASIPARLERLLAGELDRLIGDENPSRKSTIFVSNFNHLLIGVRSAIGVDVLRERFADNHQYGLVAHMRFDVAVEHAQAFHTITGVQS